MDYHTAAEIERAVEAHERGWQSRSPRAWERWVVEAKAMARGTGQFKPVEHAHGSILDGNQDVDGYSLRTARQAFERGDDPEDYIIDCVASINALRAMRGS